MKMVLKKRTPATVKSIPPSVASKPAEAPKAKEPPKPKAVKIELEEGRTFRHKESRQIYTLRKHKWKKDHWYCTREDEQGRRWATPEVPAEDMLEALKEECSPL